MDNNALFFETVKRGLWLDEPRDRRCKYVISDINGAAVASSRSLPVAMTAAMVKIQKEMTQKENQ